jgi:translocation and assembly module TamB
MRAGVAARLAGRGLFGVLWVGALVVTALAVGALAVLWTSAEARRTLLTGALAAVPGLGLEAVEGDPAGRLVIGRLTWRDATREIVAREVALDWKRWNLAARRLTLERLAIGTLEITVRAPSPPGEPPATLELPLDLALERFEIGRMLWRGASDAEPLRLGPFAGGLALGRREHSLQLERAETPWFTGGARVTLDARTLATSGELRLASRDEIAATPWRLRATLADRLPDLALQLALESRAQHAELATRIAPFATQPLSRVDARLDRVDLSAFAPALPRTALTGTVRADLADLTRPAAQVELVNGLAGAWNAGRLPVARLAGRLTRVEERVRFEGIEARLGDAQGSAGRLSLAGHWQHEGWQLRARGEAIDFARLGLDLPGRLEALELEAENRGRTATEAMIGELRGRWQPPADAPRRDTQPLTARVETRGMTVRFEAAAGSALAATLEARRAGETRWAADARLRADAFDARWLSPWLPVQSGDALSGEAEATLMLERSARAGPRLLEGRGRWTMAESRLAGLALETSGRLETAPTTVGGRPAWRGSGQLRAGGQQLAWQGGVGAPGERLLLSLEAPALETFTRLVPEATRSALGALAGDVKGTVEWTGLGAAPARSRGATPAGWPVAAVAVNLAGRRTAGAGVSADDWSLEARAHDLSGAPEAAALAVNARAGRLTLERPEVRQANDGQPLRFLQLALQVEGTLAAHSLRAEGRVQGLARHPEPLEARLALVGGAPIGARRAGAERAWQGRLTEARLVQAAPLRPWFVLEAPVALELAERGAERELRVGAGSARVDGVPVRFTAHRALHAGERLVLEGSGEAGPVAATELFAKLPASATRAAPMPSGDLRLALRWRAAGDLREALEVRLARLDGDLRFSPDPASSALALGLATVEAELRVRAGRWQLTGRLASARFGRIEAEARSPLDAGAWLPSATSPLEGTASFALTDIAPFNAWLPATWRLDGRAEGRLELGGQLATPAARGTLTAERLTARNLREGIALDEGALVIEADGERWRITEGRFRAGEGTIGVVGEGRFTEGAPFALRIDLDRARLSGRADRELIASGALGFGASRERVELLGTLRIDRGRIDVAVSDAPTLSEDVVVRRGAAGAQGAGSATHGRAAGGRLRVDVSVELGDDLRIRGRGLDAGLRGEVRASTDPVRRDLRLDGEVRVVGGRYRAYGQDLEIARGVIRLAGPPEAARLDLLALRARSTPDDAVGLAITGTAARPEVAVYSVPPRSEREALALLVTGRSASELDGREAELVQAAALALLVGEREGFASRIGLDTLAVSRPGGSGGDTVVTVGKQITDRLYVGYERGLASAQGVFELLYRITNRLSVRVRSGDETAIDAFLQLRFGEPPKPPPPSPTAPSP